MYSITICLLLVGLVSANGIVEQPAQPQPNEPIVHHQVDGPAPVVQAQPVPVHVVDYPQVAPPASFDVNKNLYMPGSLLPADSPIVNQKPPGSMVINNKEQYGVPEPAGMPANYKPFGSWGLYIGGNPPDGYYSNFYKSLEGVQGNQVSPSQAGAQVPPTSSVYKQSGPVVMGPNAYPYVYSAGELNSAYPIVNQHPSSYMMPGFGQSSPVEGVSHYAPELYATKRVGSPAQQAREISKVNGASSSQSSSSSSSPSSQSTKGGFSQQQQQQAKGYAYAPSFSPVSPFFAPAGQQQQQYAHQQQHHNQVLPYSVPVGSQIVGSQQGADGAFSPYGVHAFTRYAVKPVYGSGQSSYYQYPVDQSSYVDKQTKPQHGYSSIVYGSNQQQPFSYYQPSSFGYQAYPVGVPALQHQFASHPVAPVAPASAPIESPVVPVAPVQQAQPQQAPASPVQVTEASQSSQSESSVSQQQEQVVDKSSVKQ